MSAEIINIRQMTVADYPAVKVFMNAHFYAGEPLHQTARPGEHPIGDFDAHIDAVQLDYIGQGLSLIALQGEQVVGAIVAGSQVASDLVEHERVAYEMGASLPGRIRQFLTLVERQADIFARHQVERILYLARLCVDPVFRGQGIGARLTCELLVLGREQGYSLIVAYCSSYYSARQMAQLGMSCSYAVCYADYKDETGEAVFKPPAPHTSLRVMVMKL